ncbi:MAG: Rieske 2Fe-2S domain-containing protein [Acidobacteria bacterium]|nr:Rieske 2Fe-2S domain-containing protein [Acidobacteriota bacterium]
MKSRLRPVLPLCPAGWYMLGPSNVKPGKIAHLDLTSASLTWFRPLDGGPVQIVPSHCPHVGVHLKNGKVVADGLQCPLHHWVINREGPNQVNIPFSAVPQHLAYGMVFGHVGPEPQFSPPTFQSQNQRWVRPGKAIHFPLPWYVPLVNAFDMNHLQTVHNRVLVTEPQIEIFGPWTYQLRYTSRVTGTSLADRLMAWFSDNRIHISMTCHAGTTLIAESQVGRYRTAMMMSFRPTPEGVSLLPIYAIGGAGITRKLAIFLTQFLFNAFLRKDIQILDGIQFRTDRLGAKDETLRRFWDFLNHLPFIESSEVAV